jgi:hypothetical protein
MNLASPIRRYLRANFREQRKARGPAMPKAKDIKKTEDSVNIWLTKQQAEKLLDAIKVKADEIQEDDILHISNVGKGNKSIMIGIKD